MNRGVVTIAVNIGETITEYLTNHTAYTGLAVIVDENTKEYCYPVIRESLPKHKIIQTNSGEENKTLDSCRDIWSQLTEASFDRKALVINLGGGVIGDMGGFCAAAYKRGISFINIPTTLLAMVDASIGGKLGIDFEHYKNHIGFFKEPDEIFVYAAFLETLDPRELKSGFAEVIKHSLIADADYWPNIVNYDFDDQDWERHIRHSIEVKEAVVKSDPTEKGYRKILNFGHTIGHAIESYFLDMPGKKLLHGEAIAIGMICESNLSVKLTGLTEYDNKKIKDYILKVYGKTDITDKDVEAIVSLCQQDKKNEKGKIRFSLLESLGKATYDIDVKPDFIINSLEEYLKF
ncbi:3-dehydroquinate synthase [Bacteroidota bacterium]